MHTVCDVALEFQESTEERVALAHLRVADSPRLSGVDAEHISVLAETVDELPPIVVHRGSMRVIDGAHRLRIAMMRGQQDIRVRFFDGAERDAFVYAVHANIAHGLPLSRADRRAAAARIIRSHPEWSDRVIAKITGISHGTVGAIRQRAPGDVDRLYRIGRDGRTRPLDTTNARRLASELLTRDPSASLRQVGTVAGISPGTVRDVRDRLRRGEDPVVRARRPAPADRLPDGPQPVARRLVSSAKQARPEDVRQLLRNLRKDPSLRYSEMGRGLLRMLEAYPVVTAKPASLARAVPAHCAATVAEIARQFAVAWEHFADHIESAGRSATDAPDPTEAV